MRQQRLVYSTRPGESQLATAQLDRSMDQTAQQHSPQSRPPCSA
jgi:hypothetical protein